MWSRITNFFPGNRRSALSKIGDEVASPTSPDDIGTTSKDLDDSSIAQPDAHPDPHAASDILSEPIREPEHESDSKPPTSDHNLPPMQQAADRKDIEDMDELSARWAAARKRPLVYAHKLRLDRNRFDQHADTIQPSSRDRQQAKGSEGGLHASVPEELEAPNPLLDNGISKTSAVISTAAPFAERNISSLREETSVDQSSAPIPLQEKDVFPKALVVDANAPTNGLNLPAFVAPDSSPVIQNSHDTRELATDAPTRATRRFSMLRAVANQWRAGIAPCDYLFVVGSAAEGRKMAPVIRALRSQVAPEQVLVCVAGDHPTRTRESLSLIGISVDLELSMPGHQESLEEIRTRMITGFGKVLTEVKPQWVVVQGDGTTAAMASIAAYYTQIQVAHIEGGTTLHNVHERDESHPEVLHHLIANLFASVHFAETSWSKDALIREGVPEESIVITGNTGVDVTHETCAALGLPIGATAVRSSGVVRVLVIMEQPETVAHNLPNICHAIRNLARSVPGLYQFAWPLQADFRGTNLVNELLDRVPGVLLSGPASYEQFLRQLSECDLVLTDVEDVQEEAPSFGKPVLLLSRATQRPEASRAGITTLIGADAASIQAGVRTLARKLSVRHGSITNPYGDGKAAVRILDFFGGRQVLEFGRTALPRLSATGESQSMRRLGTSSSAN